MKITGKNPLIDAQVKLKDNAKELKARPRKARAAGLADRVNVSAKARKLANLRKLVEASPEVREEKIERIKNDIDSGKYNMKSAKVAEGIIRKAINFYKSSHHLD
ncbi:MAG: flagellar biosynthesis anti-sigma factor FlgM [Thermodesulfobacteriota bacterium]